MESRKLKKNTTRPRPTRQMTAKRHTHCHVNYTYSIRKQRKSVHEYSKTELDHNYTKELNALE